ncbi:SCP2 domain-containing protein [Thalassomonas sp. M1454]|uniref:ubiquinone biosynthesis accessory factor UbiJ n=1 Tax=Thalassomonas sp. M1454 TaxID=2594477 RepID=UPI00117E1EA4|nr:SCP2 sterol-binding domain-containing protein [Thalassomonas sp. M1454]TRX55098.1 hypothetical protein FNN08_10905 [Thalassomonas sp. M1454]
MNVEQLMPKQMLTAIIEIIINKALSLDSNITEPLSKLNGKSLTLQITELDYPITLNVELNTVSVIASSHSDDCVIHSNFASLAKLKQTELLTSLIRSGDLDIVGDLKIAQQFAGIAEQLNIDWEKQLAERIGDIPAYRLNSLGAKLLDKLNFAKAQISQDASEYLLHEKRLLVTDSELSAFSSKVKAVELELNKLQSKLDLLQNRIN